MGKPLEHPCVNCPFLREGGIRLREERYEEILITDGTFNCHKTTRQTGDGTERPCAGWLGFIVKNPEYAGQMARILGRLGMVNENADYLAKLFDDLEEMQGAAI
jgi:hypothetical protein